MGIILAFLAIFGFSGVKILKYLPYSQTVIINVGRFDGLKPEEKGILFYGKGADDYKEAATLESIKIDGTSSIWKILELKNGDFLKPEYTNYLQVNSHILVSKKPPKFKGREIASDSNNAEVYYSNRIYGIPNHLVKGNYIVGPSLKEPDNMGVDLAFNKLTSYRKKNGNNIYFAGKNPQFQKMADDFTVTYFNRNLAGLMHDEVDQNNDESDTRALASYDDVDNIDYLSDKELRDLFLLKKEKRNRQIASVANSYFYSSDATIAFFLNMVKNDAFIGSAPVTLGFYTSFEKYVNNVNGLEIAFRYGHNLYDMPDHDNVESSEIMITGSFAYYPAGYPRLNRKFFPYVGAGLGIGLATMKHPTFLESYSYRGLSAISINAGIKFIFDIDKSSLLLTRLKVNALGMHIRMSYDPTTFYLYRTKMLESEERVDDHDLKLYVGVSAYFGS